MITVASGLFGQIDLVGFAAHRLGFTPDPKQALGLSSPATRGILNCTRQWGKSTVTAARAVYHAFHRPKSLCLVLSPSARQSAEFLCKVKQFLRRLDIRPRGDGHNEVSVLLPNAARIVGLPGNDDTIPPDAPITGLLRSHRTALRKPLWPVAVCEPAGRALSHDLGPGLRPPRRFQNAPRLIAGLPPNALRSERNHNPDTGLRFDRTEASPSFQRKFPRLHGLPACGTLMAIMRLTSWKFDRRGLFRHGGLAAVAGLFGLPRPSAAAPGGGSNIYTGIGVRPIVNCKGTFTIITGSLTLPEVKKAMDDASRHYVHLDELMDAVGRRLGELTKSEWGIVTAGCAAALTHATAACLAGTDPEKIQRLPNLDGLKSEVIVPRYSRNVYDQAVRMLGVRMVEVNTAEEYEAAFNEKTAMVMVLATQAADSGPLSTENICRIARRNNVPVIVDAAAEHLTIPSIHLQRGAHMVAYSGGKCIRGPQCAGILLGDKKLLQAAWINSAPHHAFGRSLKVGKEEIMGMLAAVEAWTRRDHDAEWKTWESWLNHISARVTKINGVTTEVLQPRGLSNRSPQLRIRWDGAKLGITGEEAEKLLYQGDPRIIFGAATGNRREGMESSLTIMPYMMTPDDHKVAADAIHAVLSKPPKQSTTPASGPAAQVAGQWKLRIDFLLGTTEHGLFFEQSNDNLLGSHRGEITTGDLRGVVDGSEVRFRSAHRYEGTTLRYDFAGSVSGGTMRGKVDLGEYGEADWSAERYQYPEPRRRA